MKNVIRGFVALALLAIVLAPVFAAPAVGDTPPTITDIDAWINADNADWAASDLDWKTLEGDVVLLEFWATWCPPCRKAIPHLVELNEEHANDGLKIVTITATDQRQTEDRVRQFVKDTEGMTYAVGTTANFDVYKNYGVSGIPKAFLIGRDGKLAWSGSPLDPELDAVLEKALAERAN